MSYPAAAIVPEASRPRPHWRLAALDTGAAERLARTLDLPLPAARLLVARGHGEPDAAARFLAPSLEHLHDPFLLQDMDRAVARLTRALDAGERITVYGDYDVDGVTSTASLVSFLRECGAEVDAYIPRRLTEGYGLNLDAVEKLAERGTRLLVTCDCGVTAVEEVDRAVALGLEVIVIDHHRVPAVLPRATAILNPYRDGNTFPFPHMAAVGVTFNLLMALRKRLREAGWFAARRLREPNLLAYLDLVALGTVADVVPLVDENRVLVFHGLKVLAQGRRIGVSALKNAAGIGPGEVSAGQVGFRLGPRINAAGRLADARAGLDLLLTTDPAEASRLARVLDEANAERQAIERDIVDEAARVAEAMAPGRRGLVLAGEGWHTGVVGIVASRIVERFHRPTLVLGVQDGEVRGSGRSVPALNLYEALDACSAHLTRFGGHKAAAGLSMEPEALPAFTERFLAECAARLTDDDLVAWTRVDGEVDPAEVDEALVEAVGRLAPFGMGNPTPVFVARAGRVEAARVVGAKRGSDGHLKGAVAGHDAIGFGLGRSLGACREPVDLAFTVGFDEWTGVRRVQLGLKAVARAGDAVLVRAGASGDPDTWGHVHV